MMKRFSSEVKKKHGARIYVFRERISVLVWVESVGVRKVAGLTCPSATIVHLLFASYHTTYQYFSSRTLVVFIVVFARSNTNFNPGILTTIHPCLETSDTRKLVPHVNPKTAYR